MMAGPTDAPFARAVQGISIAAAYPAENGAAVTKCRHLFALLLAPALLVAVPARAESPEPAPPAVIGMPAWERTLFKTLTYQAAANLSDLVLYDLVLAGTAAAGTSFVLSNAVSAATLYYGYEYAWQLLGPPPGERTTRTVVEKTILYRVFNSSRNFTLGYVFGGSAAAGGAFVLANFATDTVLFVTNEYAWDHFRPLATRP
jgi:uncharacterized membrane protein